MGSSKHQQRNPQTRSQKPTLTIIMKFAKSFALAAVALVGTASAVELTEASTCNVATTGLCAVIDTKQAAIDTLTSEPSDSDWLTDTKNTELVAAYTAAINAKCNCVINGAESLTLGVAAALPMVAYALQ